jgi:hypothetical protein
LTYIQTIPLSWICQAGAGEGEKRGEVSAKLVLLPPIGELFPKLFLIDLLILLERFQTEPMVLSIPCLITSLLLTHAVSIALVSLKWLYCQMVKVTLCAIFTAYG